MKPDADGRIPPHHDNCLGCGPGNPAGFALQMHAVGGCVVATTHLDHRHEGAPGLAHGGAVATLLDDLFGGVLVMLETPAVTGNLTVDFRAPVPLRVPLQLEGRCTSQLGRKLTMRGTLRRDGELLAEATALFLQVDLRHFEANGMPIPEPWRRWGDFDASEEDADRVAR